MPKNYLLLAFAVVSALTFFSACTAYGPAYSHQRLTYMERPFSQDLDSKSHAQVYASGKFGTDATYLQNESNQNGELGVHIGLDAYILQLAVGIVGFGGRYTDAKKETFGYNGFGVRLHQNWKIPVNKDWEIQILGYGYSFNSESGQYSKLRTRNIDSIGAVKDLGMFSLTTGFRYRSPNKTIWGFQYAYGTTGFYVTPINASHCFSFTGNFARTTVAVNLSLPHKSELSFGAGLDPTISIGITQGLTRNGF